VPSTTAKSSAIESHFSAAQKAQQDKDYATAEREYRAVLTLAPDFAEVHMNLGLVYQLQARSTEAMAEFRRALKVKPGLTGANFFLGVDYCKLGDGGKAYPLSQGSPSGQNLGDRIPGSGWQRRKRSPASYKPKSPRCSGR